MQHTVDKISRIGVGSRVGGLETTALVNRYIDHDRASLHHSDHVASHELRGRRARNQYGPDHQVGKPKSFTDRPCVGRECHYLTVIDIVQRSESVEVLVDNRDVRAKPYRHLGRVVSNNPTTKNRNVRCSNTRDAAKQNSPSAIWRFKV